MHQHLVKGRDSWKKIGLAIALGCIVAFVAAEAAVRLFPGAFIRYLEPYDKQELVFNPEVGCLRAPSKDASLYRSCMRISSIGLNSFGFRGYEWQAQALLRIAVLGDSFMEALQVADADTTSVVLGKLLHAEVYNASLSETGTAKEVLFYRKFVKPFKPQAVILFFLGDNDVSESSCRLRKMIFGAPSDCCYDEEGAFRISNTHSTTNPKMVFNSQLQGIKRAFKVHCRSCLVLNRFIFQRVFPYLPPREDRRQLNRRYWEVYISKETSAWQSGWRIVEGLLSALKNEVESSGARLLVVNVPLKSYDRKDWEKWYPQNTGGASLPEEFDPFYPLKKIESICQKSNIPLLKLEPYFFDYKNRFNMSEPYLTYQCDGHWNPIGHFLASHIVARYLLKHDWIPLAENEKKEALEKIEKDLQLSPEQILGKAAFDQIYRGGVYRGSSNITRILEDDTVQ